MKLGKLSLAGAGVLVAGGLAWVLMRTEPADTPQVPGETAVVEQPSGKVVTGSGAESTHAPEVDGKAGPGKSGDPDSTAAVGDPDVKPDPAKDENAGRSLSDGAAGDNADAKPDVAGPTPTAGQDGDGEGPSERPTVAAGEKTPDSAKDATDVAQTDRSDGAATTGGTVVVDDERPESPGAKSGAPADAGVATTGVKETTPPPDGTSDAAPRDGDEVGDTGDGAGSRIAAVDPTEDRPEAGRTDKPEGTSRADGADAPEPAKQEGNTDTTTAPTDADPNTPTFDVVRIDPSGQTVLAGRAGPHQRVEVTLDGEVVETVTTDGDGAFVAILTTPLSGSPQQLQLRVPAPAGAGDEAGASKPDGTAAREPATAGGNEAPGKSVTTPGDDASGPPEVDVSTPVLVRPEMDNGRGVATGGSDGGVARADGASGLSAPVGPAASGADRIARTAETRRGAAALPPSPEDLAAEPKGNGDLRTGAAEPAVTGARTEPGTSVATSGTGDEPDAPPEPDNVSPLPAPGAPTVMLSPDGAIGRPGEADQPLAGARSDPDGPKVATVDDAPRTPGQVAGTRFLKSAPVIILPASEPEEAPTLLKSTRQDLKILQPSVSDINSVVLDRISYGETGDVILAGRGRAGRAVRVYGNGLLVGTTQIDADGTWMLSVAPERGREIKLLRMDELDDEGRVLTRVEAPFTYSQSSPKLVRQREVTINKGDMLWRIAEQHYGEGMRFSVIYGANAKLIRDPDLIYPGQVFTVPELVDAVPER